MRQEKTCRPRKGRWPLPRERCNVCGRQWRLLPSVLILMTSAVALFWGGCATTRKNLTEEMRTESGMEKHDSVASATRVIRKESVPASRAEITIPVDSLLKLPGDASYTQHNGQATATVTKKGEVIYVAASCDSLQREVEYYEGLYYRARDALEQYERDVRTQKEQRPEAPAIHDIVNFLIGIAGGVVITVFTIIIKKRQWQ